MKVCTVEATNLVNIYRIGMSELLFGEFILIIELSQGLFELGGDGEKETGGGFVGDKHRRSAGVKMYYGQHPVDADVPECFLFS